MRRKIRLSLTGVSVLCVLMAAIVLTLIFFRFHEDRMFAAVDHEARLLGGALSVQDDPVVALKATDLTLRDDRVTLIGADGQVIFDNYASPEAMDNHADREEVRGALAQGRASTNRYSATLNRQTYYSAVRLDNGQILRVAKTMDSILGVFLNILFPFALVVLAVWLAGYLIAKPVTAWIIAPINEIDISRDDRPVYEELSPLVERIIHQNEMIGEQVRLLKNRADTIQAIMDSMREGLVIISGKKEILSANASALALFGLKEAPAILFELTRNWEITDCANRAIAGERCEYILETGGRITQVYFSPVEHERGDGAILFFLDITERANAEQIRREFSANVSHELKTPLTVIAGLSEMLCTGMARQEDALSFAERIHAESVRLQALIDDIIKLSELDEGGEVQRQLVDLYALAESALAALKPLADEKKILARLEGEHIVMMAQQQQMHELLFNLIDNGIKYNRQGGELTVAITKEGGRVQIRVRDTGIGIPKDKLSRVFERFYRVDSSRSRQTGGTGLGLSIVKHIALVHGGHVEVESEEGMYTEVKVFL